jgi:hypothetical protein
LQPNAYIHDDWQESGPPSWYSLKLQTLLSLCLVSRRLRNIAQPILYHEFMLKSLYMGQPTHFIHADGGTTIRSGCPCEAGFYLPILGEEWIFAEPTCYTLIWRDSWPACLRLATSRAHHAPIISIHPHCRVRRTLAFDLYEILLLSLGNDVTRCGCDSQITITQKPDTGDNPKPMCLHGGPDLPGHWLLDYHANLLRQNGRLRHTGHDRDNDHHYER